MATTTHNFLEIWRDGMMTSSRQALRLQRSFDRLFEEFFSPIPRILFGGTEGVSVWNPACDIDETDSEYLVKFEIPGVSKDDVRVVMNNNQLIISGERKEDRPKEGVGRVSSETYHGAFQRSINLPGSVEAQNVEAHYQDGILRIRVPKMEQAKVTKQVQVQEGAGQMAEQQRAPQRVPKSGEKAA